MPWSMVRRRRLVAFLSPITPVPSRDSPITRSILFTCTPELEEQLVDAVFPGRQTLQVKLAFQLREVLLARAPVSVQPEDIGIRDLHKVRPDAEDFDLGQQKDLALLAGSLGHLVDQPDSSDSIPFAGCAPRVDGLAGPRRVSVPLLSGQGDQNLGGLMAKVVAGDETVPGLESRDHERGIIKSRVIDPQQAGMFMISRARCRTPSW